MTPRDFNKGRRPYSFLLLLVVTPSVGRSSSDDLAVESCAPATRTVSNSEQTSWMSSWSLRPCSEVGSGCPEASVLVSFRSAGASKRSALIVEDHPVRYAGGNGALL